MKRRIVRLTESDLTRIVKRVLNETVETEEEFLDSDSLLFGDSTKNEIKWDLKREKNKNKLVRTSGDFTQQWNDLVYGYDRFDQKYVGVRKNGKYTEENIANGLRVSKKDTKDAGDRDSTIVYKCEGDGENIGYVNIFNVSEDEKNMDRRWLDSWCKKINWTSRVGKNKGLFRKEIRRF
jgi:hypothetical protein